MARLVKSIADSGFDLKASANGVCHREASTPHSLALILADYDAISGAWVSGYLYVRSAREAIEIRFLIDTGAAPTCVAAGELLPALMIRRCDQAIPRCPALVEL